VFLVRISTYDSTLSGHEL